MASLDGSSIRSYADLAVAQAAEFGANRSAHAVDELRRHRYKIRGSLFREQPFALALPGVPHLPRKGRMPASLLVPRSGCHLLAGPPALSPSNQEGSFSALSRGSRNQ